MCRLIFNMETKIKKKLFSLNCNPELSKYKKLYHKNNSLIKTAKHLEFLRGTVIIT